MPKPRAATLPAIAAESRIENVCPLKGCSNRLRAWTQCSRPDCPKSAAELVTPFQKEEA